MDSQLQNQKANRQNHLPRSGERKATCFRWSSTGSCQYGSECRYYHNNVPNSESAEKPAIARHSVASSVGDQERKTMPASQVPPPYSSTQAKSTVGSSMVFRILDTPSNVFHHAKCWRRRKTPDRFKQITELEALYAGLVSANCCKGLQ